MLAHESASARGSEPDGSLVTNAFSPSGVTLVQKSRHLALRHARGISVGTPVSKATVAEVLRA